LFRGPELAWYHSDTVNELLQKLTDGLDLSVAETSELILAILRREWSDDTTAQCLLAWRTKGETVAEIVGAAGAMRELMKRIASHHATLIDTCGTGGDGASTFNISTAAAIVTAAAGLPVAKHGNRSVSSKSGSADVLRELGVDVEAPLDRVEECLNTLDICFCYAPLCHESVRSVSSVRAQLKVPTIFNWLGPLANPAQAGFQLLGVGRPELREKMAQVVATLGTKRTAVVSGRDGLDEVTLAAATDVSLVSGAGIQQLVWTPATFGLDRSDLSSLTVSSPAESAEMIRSVLSGEAGPARDIVVLNAAAALWVAGVDPDEQACRRRAERAIDCGLAAERLALLGELSRQARS
jgi:anthranilate phosphoribosyltransferase